MRDGCCLKPHVPSMENIQQSKAMFSDDILRATNESAPTRRQNYRGNADCCYIPIIFHSRIAFWAAVRLRTMTCGTNTFRDFLFFSFSFKGQAAASETPLPASRLLLAASEVLLSSSQAVLNYDIYSPHTGTDFCPNISSHCPNVISRPNME